MTALPVVYERGDCSRCAGREDGVKCAAEPRPDRAAAYHLCVLCEREPERQGPAVRRLSRQLAGIPEPPPPPPKPGAAFRRKAGLLNVGFLGSGYWFQGGTERWHQILLPRLAASAGLHVVGYAVGWENSGPAIPGVPVEKGDDAIAALVRSCDVLVAWGTPDLPRHLPADRPRVVAVSHGSARDEWNLSCMAGMGPVADVRAAVSPEAARAWGDPRRVHVVPNGIDPEAMRPTADRATLRRAIGLDPGDVACLAVGWVSEGKRVGLAAEAVRRLGEPYRLVVAGEGPLLDAVRLAGGDRVIALGTRPDVPDLMAACDLLVHPSQSEGAAFVHVEAMHAGLPIVGTPVGILADDRSLARVVPIDADAAAWAEAVRRDFEEVSARWRRARHAHHAATALYTADAMTEGWLRLIRSAAPARPQEPPPPPKVSVTAKGPSDPWATLHEARACDYRATLTTEEASGFG